VQSLIWGDYEAQPETNYSYRVVAMYGDIGHLQERTNAPSKFAPRKKMMASMASGSTAVPSPAMPSLPNSATRR